MRLRYRFLILSSVTGIACATGERESTTGGVDAGGEDGAAVTVGGVFSDSGVSPDTDSGGVVADPVTCAEAATNKSYIGCDYWPTVTPNTVWSIFDFAVVITNPGAIAADVTIVGPDSFKQSLTVGPNQVGKVYLPWIPDLKGPDADGYNHWIQKPTTLLKRQGAYHLTSTYPVLAYQFSPIEYAPTGGPVGKDWSTCPAGMPKGPDLPEVACLSYTNDASLLLPSTAMTGNYRVSTVNGYGDSGGVWGYVSLTATQDGTTVKLKLGSGGIVGGAGVTEVSPFGTASYTMDAGDVLQLAGAIGSALGSADLSGALVQADRPVQLMGSAPSISIPSIASAGHVEETVMPVETLGRRYAVTRPSSSAGDPGSIVVKFIGNVDGTHLLYSSAVVAEDQQGKPIVPPTTLNAGEVVVINYPSEDFVVEGDHEFIVTTLQSNNPFTNNLDAQNDPGLSNAVALEQFRLKYIFLAPDDYANSFIDIVAPKATRLTLDGVALTEPPAPIGTSGYGVLRVRLDRGSSGVHLLESNLPAGLQVVGYGKATSYQYPAGLNLLRIAPPPPPIVLK